MSSTKTGQTIVLDTGHSGWVYALSFHPDGKHLLSGGDDGVRRWGLADGQEIGRQTGMDLNAISVSRDHKWVVCGMLEGGVGVWDAELREKVIHVEGKNSVFAVDVSPDSTKFATATLETEQAIIWSLTTGKKLVDPLQHDDRVTGIKSPQNGEGCGNLCVSLYSSH